VELYVGSDYVLTKNMNCGIRSQAAMPVVFTTTKERKKNQTNKPLLYRPVLSKVGRLINKKTLNVE